MAVFPLLLAVLLLPSVHASRCVDISPDPDPDHGSGHAVELGKEFTATCLLRQKDLRADNIVWAYSNGHTVIPLPRQLYRKINDSAGSITVNVTQDMRSFFTCTVDNHDTIMQSGCRYGILLDKGYPPEKPTGVRCQTVQVGSKMSNDVSCRWNPGTRDPVMHTNYTLYIEDAGDVYHSSVSNSSGTVVLKIFPHHMDVKIWVEVENRLGKATSDVLMQVADSLIKTNPPANVNITSEQAFPKSLLIQWRHSIDRTYVLLKYNIRFCEKDSHTWSEVPPEETKDYQDSFRLQALQPYTEYRVQVRCKNQKDLGYWSDWSRNATARTAEDLWSIDRNLKKGQDRPGAETRKPYVDASPCPIVG